MSSALPSLPPGQMAKLDNMLSKITLKSHGHVCLSAPACLTEPLPPSLTPPGHLCWGVVAGHKRGGIVWNGGDGAAAGASLIAAD